MKRREFLAVLSAAVPWPLMARAQQPARRPRVAVLIYTTPETDPNTQSFRRGMRDLGYIEGSNIDIDYRFAEGRMERLPALAAEIVRMKPDVLFSLGGDVTQVSVAATHTIPIVFVSSADPVQLGFVKSLAQPAGNATGVTLLLDETASKRLEFLKEVAPSISKVALIYNPDHVDNELREAERAASRLGVKLYPVALTRSDNLDNTLRMVGEAKVDALYVVSSRQTVSIIDKLVDFATQKRLPLAGGWGAWAKGGALLSYGPNVEDMTRRASGYVDKILKGSKPADLPAQQPTKFELLVNLKTAKALGLSIPESFLLRADRLIE